MNISQRKFNYIQKELRQYGIDQDDPRIVHVRNEAIEAAEILTLKEIKQLIYEHLELKGLV